MTPPPHWAFADFGDRSIIVPPARVENPGQISIGSGVLIHEHAWLLVRDATPGSRSSLTIGDATVVNRFVKLVCLESIEIGAGVILGDRVYISDVDYEPGASDMLPDDRSLTTPAPVVLEAGAALGVGVIVKPGVRIGERAYIGAGSIVTKDVPPRCLAVGNPARVVRRYDPETNRW